MLIVKPVSSSSAVAKCPKCGKTRKRHHEARRRISHLGSRNKGLEIEITFSVHRCRTCKRSFLTPKTEKYISVDHPKLRYSRRFVRFALEKLQQAEQLKIVKRKTPMKHTERTGPDFELIEQCKLKYVREQILKETSIKVAIPTLCRWKMNFIELQRVTI